jgi:hypothetical protein
MSNTTEIKLHDERDAVIGISSEDGVAALSFSGVDGLRWIQVGPEKMREIAKALEDAAAEVEAAA